jgi:tetratricopeptide (TPR) repeat protein
MNPVEFDKNESYFENLQTITNFFKRYKSVGFLFAVANFRQVVNDVNLNVINESTAIGKKVNIIELDWNGQKGILTQLEFFLKENPSNGLIINNIDELIEESKGEIIYSLNYAREGLIALNIPILYWLNDENHARFSLEAIDLYLRRDFSTVFFEDIDLSQEHLLLNAVFSDKYQTTEDYQNTRIRIELLEKQLHEAEEKGYPPQKIAREIVVDLILQYYDTFLVNQALELIERYSLYLDMKNSALLNDISLIYKRLGFYEKAKELLEEALPIAIDKFGEFDSKVSVILCNLGTVYQDLYLFVQSKSTLEKALKIQIAYGGVDNPKTLLIQLNLAETYQKMGELSKAKILFEKTLSKMILFFGENSISVAITENNLGTVYRIMGETNKAKNIIKKALKTQIEKFGEIHLEVAASQANLGRVYADTGRFELAKQLLEKSLDTHIKILGNINHNVALGQINLSHILYDMGQFGSSLYYAQKAYDTMKGSIGEKHPNTKKALQHLQSLQQKSLTQSEA